MCVIQYCSFLQQISMSATITMVAVHKPAPTQMVHSSAAVDLGLDWTVMEELAVVSADMDVGVLPLSSINHHVIHQ